MKRFLSPILVALGLLLLVGRAEAQFPSNVPDTFRLQLGGAYTWFNTGLTFQETSAGTPVGPEVNLEDVLDLPNSRAGFLGSGSWNFAGRSFIDFGWMGFSRSHTATISQDIIFGDTTYTAGASISTKMSSSMPYVGYRYGFIKDESNQLGLSLGAAYVELKTELSAAAGVVGPGGPIIGQSVTKTAKEALPVPLLGFSYEGRIAEGWSAGIRAIGIFAPVHPYTGSVFYGIAHVDWYPSQNFGVGAGYEYSRYALKKSNDTAFIEYHYRFDGPTVYLILTF